MNDGDTFQHDGATFRVNFTDDDTADPPWLQEDGHGPVSEWRYHGQGQGTKPPKAPGERLLLWDRGSYRTYDFAEACKIARRDAWGAAGDESMTPRQKAAHAAEADFLRLRAWCNAEWTYVGVTVELLDDAGEPLGLKESLWGIESDASEHLDEVAHDLADEILLRLRAAMGSGAK
jgi:hypothetical protein